MCEKPLTKRNRGLNKPKEFSTVYGWGINDAEYKVTKLVDGKLIICPFYKKWHSIISRAHCENYFLKRPSCKDNKICLEWKRFSVFKIWMESQEWEGLDLDKDILVLGNKLYSPETCRFVPNYINQLTSPGNRSADPTLPFGVQKNKSSSRAKQFYTRIQRRDGAIYLGSFYTALEAHLVWTAQKANYIEESVSFWANDPKTKHSFSYEIADSLLDRVWKMRLNVLNKQETLLI